jgi:hypothetical protein
VGHLPWMKFDVRYRGLLIVGNDYLGILPRDVTVGLSTLVTAAPLQARCYGNHETHQR